jgi:hypothetical protein
MLAFSFLAAAPALAGDFDLLDVFMVKVKPDRRADFDAFSRKLVEANRRNKGDVWIASQTEYGDPWVTFTTPRAGFPGIEDGMKRFEKALAEAYGPAAKKIMQDGMTCVEASRGELRRLRKDLSSNMPEDLEAYQQRIGRMRWISQTKVTVRRGHNDSFEESLRGVVKLRQANDPGTTIIARQTAAGASIDTYYFSVLRDSLADFDRGKPMREVLGEDRFREFAKMNAEDVLEAEVTIARVVPEWSNPPEAVVNVSRDFWRPKTTSVAARRTRPATAAPPAQQKQ